LGSEGLCEGRCGRGAVSAMRRREKGERKEREIGDGVL